MPDPKQTSSKSKGTIDFTGFSFVMVCENVADALRWRDITPDAVCMWYIIGTYANKEHKSWPGQEKLAEDMGISTRQVRRLIKQLVDADLLLIKYRKQNSNIYTLVTTPKHS